MALFAFAGTSSQVWDLKSKQKVYEVLNHRSEITDACFMPLQGLVAVCSADASWSLHDYKNGKTLLNLQENAKISSLQFHPDGLIMALGLSNGNIKVYDVRDMQLAQELEGPCTAAVSQLSFSNKGIFLAASWEGQDTCRVYSLHKAFAFNDIK
jgi:pre-mRNA-processing factor 19